MVQKVKIKRATTADELLPFNYGFRYHLTALLFAFSDLRVKRKL